MTELRGMLRKMKTELAEVVNYTLLPELLIPPSPLKRDHHGRLKKKCTGGVFRRATRY